MQGVERPKTAQGDSCRDGIDQDATREGTMCQERVWEGSVEGSAVFDERTIPDGKRDDDRRSSLGVCLCKLGLEDEEVNQEAEQRHGMQG